MLLTHFEANGRLSTCWSPGRINQVGSCFLQRHTTPARTENSLLNRAIGQVLIAFFTCAEFGVLTHIRVEVVRVNDKGQAVDYRIVPVTSSHRYFDVEPFVDADVIAEFLSVKRKTILDWARAAIIPAHPFGRGNRVVWRFRISEIAHPTAARP